MNNETKAWFVVSLILSTTLCNASRISGTYVSDGSTFTEMLQLTQADNGQISGVLSSIELKADGNITSEQSSVSGVVDASQLTLTIRSVLPLFGGTTLSGSVHDGKIDFQIAGAKGNVSSAIFVRGTPTDFKVLADQMRSKAAGIVVSRKLSSNAQMIRQTLKNAEDWIANAELHASRIPQAENDYRTVEDRMQSLVERERSKSPNSVARAQISVRVSQGDVAGVQIDSRVDQTWDLEIARSGSKLEDGFAEWKGDCSTREELRKHGASEQAIDDWENACNQVSSERAKFESIYNGIMQKRADLKKFQAESQARRKALIAESNRIE